MKKAILFSLSLIAIATISSCKKDRICTCTVETTGTFNFTVTGDTTFTNVSSGDAETKCSALDFNVTSGNETSTATCALK